MQVRYQAALRPDELHIIAEGHYFLLRLFATFWLAAPITKPDIVRGRRGR